LILEGILTYHLIVGAILHGPPPQLRENIVASNNEYRCLLRNVWWESASESFIGKLWVAKTTLNRVRSSKFPNSICKTVYQRKQFSWTHTVKNQVVIPKTDLEKKVFAEIELASFISIWLDRFNFDFTSNSKYYHTLQAKPIWRHSMYKTSKIGNHQFYKDSND
jgi:spore germination cell wall hydrolase CwlJ-like protein